MADISKPAAEQTVVYEATELDGANILFDFAEADKARDGYDLVLTFGDGAKLVFTDLFQILARRFSNLELEHGLPHLGPDDYMMAFDLALHVADPYNLDTLYKPGADHSWTLPPSVLAKAQMQFALDETTPSRDGDNLVLTFKDGGKLVFDKFFEGLSPKLFDSELQNGLEHLGPDDYASMISYVRHNSESFVGVWKHGNDGGNTAPRDGDAPAWDSTASARDANASMPNGNTAARNGETDQQNGNTGSPDGNAGAQHASTAGQDGNAAAQDGSSQDGNSTQDGNSPSQNGETSSQQGSSQAVLEGSRFNLWSNSELQVGVPHIRELDTGFNTGVEYHDTRNTVGDRHGIIGPEVSAYNDKLDISGPSEPSENTSGKIFLKEEGVNEGGNVYQPGILNAGGRMVLPSGVQGKVASWTLADKYKTDDPSKFDEDTTEHLQMLQTPQGILTLHTDTGRYEFDLNNSAVQPYDNDTREVFTYDIVPLGADGRPLANNGSEAVAPLTVTIDGTNDQPVLKVLTPTPLSVAHGGTETDDSGTYEVTDPDGDGVWSSGGSNAGHKYELAAGLDTTAKVVSNGALGSSSTITTDYGTLTVKPDGTYGFVLAPDSPKVIALGAGETHTDVVRVRVVDKHGAYSEDTISIVITGQQDAGATWSTAGSPTHNLVEAGVQNGGNTPLHGTPSAGGSLSVATADSNATVSFGVTVDVDIRETTPTADGGCVLKTDYGTFTLKQNGHGCDYSFTLENGGTAVNSMNAGATKNITFIITGTRLDGGGDTGGKTVTYTVTGTNDRPELTLRDASTIILTDGGSTSATRNFDVDDPDADGAWAYGNSSNTGHKYELAAGLGTTAKVVSNGDLGGNSTITTEYGTLTVKPDGTYEYVVDRTSEAVIALGASQKVTENFVVKVVDAHGAYDTKTIAVEINGKSDGPKFGTFDSKGLTVTEKGHGKDNVPVDGVKTAGDTLVATITDGDAANGGIRYSIDPKVTFKIDGSSSTADLADKLTNGNQVIQTEYGALRIVSQSAHGKEYQCKFEFVLNDNADVVNALPEGKTVTVAFKIIATDKNGNSTPQDVVYSITGTNDKPVFEQLHYTAATTLVEDGTETVARGKVGATDVDTGDNATLTYTIEATDEQDDIRLVPILPGQYGRLILEEATGNYEYHLNNVKTQPLAAGQVVNDVFHVRVTDSTGAYHTATVAIPIMGTEDKPVLTGALTNDIHEDWLVNEGKADQKNIVDAARIVTKGQLTARDIDTIFDPESGATRSFAIAGQDKADAYTVEGTYGTLVLNKDGSYSYTFTENGEHQDWAPSNVYTDTFSVQMTTTRVLDGKTYTSVSDVTPLEIRVHGSNDAPVIVDRDDYNLEISDAAVAVTGQLVVTDVDHDQQVVQDTSTVHAGEIKSKAHSFYFEVTTENGVEKVQSITGAYGNIRVHRTTGEYTYTPDPYADFSGLGDKGTDETFTIVVDDGRGGTDKRTINVHLDAAIATTGASGPGAVSDLSDFDGTGYDLLTGGAITVIEDDFDPVATNVIGTGFVSGALPSGGMYGFAVPGVSGGYRFSLVAHGRYGSITMDKDGNYTYTLDNELTAVQQQGVHDSPLTETFTLWGGKTITVNITPNNDTPVLESHDRTIEVTQKDGEDAVSTTGFVTARDIDITDTISFSLSKDTYVTTQSYTFAVDGAGKITGYHVTTGSETPHFTIELTQDGDKCSYVLKYLKEGLHLTRDDSTTVDFKVFAHDDSGADNAVSEPVTVTAHIQGINTPPKWTDAKMDIGVKEDNLVSGSVTYSGRLLENVTDDTGQDASSGLSFAILANGRETMLHEIKGFGTLLITDPSTGAYTFTLSNQDDNIQKLGVGATQFGDFQIVVTDKHGGCDMEHPLTLHVTATGSNDRPVITQLTQLNIYADRSGEGSTAASAVQAMATDKDGDDLTFAATFKNASDGSAKDAYGQLHFEKDGAYWFQLDRESDAFQNLKETDTIYLHYNVTANDGKGITVADRGDELSISEVADLVITVTGANTLPGGAMASALGRSLASLPDAAEPLEDMDALLADSNAALQGLTEMEGLEAKFGAGLAGDSASGAVMPEAAVSAPEADTPPADTTPHEAATPPADSYQLEMAKAIMENS